MNATIDNIFITSLLFEVGLLVAAYRYYASAITTLDENFVIAFKKAKATRATDHDILAFPQYLSRVSIKVRMFICGVSFLFAFVVTFAKSVVTSGKIPENLSKHLDAILVGVLFIMILCVLSLFFEKNNKDRSFGVPK